MKVKHLVAMSWPLFVPCLLLAQGWTVETVLGPHAWHASLELDSHGRPCIAYQRNVASDRITLNYGVREGPLWHHEYVGEIDLSINPSGLDLALDAQDRPHIAYRRPRTGRGLHYAFHNGTSWLLSTLETAPNGHVGIYCSIALDPVGYPVISYWDRNAGVGEVAWRNWAGWDVDVIPLNSSSNEWYPTSLAIDAEGRAHVVGARPDYRSMFYGMKEGGSWAVQDDVESTDLGTFPKVVVDDEGGVHVAFAGRIGDLPGGLRYAFWDGSSWTSELVDTVGTEFSIALDQSGKPRLAYSNADGLQHAMRSGAGWMIDQVDARGRWIQQTCIAIDEQGNSHITYYDSHDNNLWYATGIPEPATLSLLAVGGLAMIRRRRR